MLLSPKRNCVWVNEDCRWDSWGYGLPSHSDTYLTCLLWQRTSRSSSPLVPVPKPRLGSQSWTTITSLSYGPCLPHFSSPINLILLSCLCYRHSVSCSPRHKNLSAISHPYFFIVSFLILGFKFLNDQNLLSVHPHKLSIYMGILTNPQRICVEKNQPFCIPKAEK